VAVFDGLLFDAVNGKAVPGEKFRARTMWGWIAWSLGQKKGYDLFKNQDEARVAPGGDEILTLLKESGPNLILLDEVLNYLISAGGIRVEQTTLRDETLTFLQRLTVAVGNTSNTALVFSLQSSKRESLEYVNLLNMVDHLAARKDQRREPVEMDEVLHVIQRRLLARIPDESDGTPAATTYQEIITQMKRSYANTPAEAHLAEEEGISLRNRVLTARGLQKAVSRAVQEGAFGYFSGPQPTMGPDGRYQGNESKVAYGRTVLEDEIDLDTGFLMMPDAIPRTKPTEPPGPGPVPPGPIPPEPEPPGPGPIPPSPPDAQKTVNISFAANRDQLFGAWQAIANLADMAGKIEVSVSATSEEGFDRNKLRNAVIEPLQEADLIE